MKSLIRKPRKESLKASPERTSLLRVKPQKAAQCCAKISKTVAGCHD